jgi:CheY-like chemotaxis protein
MRLESGRMAEQHLNGGEIFVVDDDELMRDTLSAVFEPEGCRVTCFAEGQSFLVAARSRTPACILLDVNMPGRSGLDMLRELDAPHYPAPILIVSGQRDVPTAVNASRATRWTSSRSRSRPRRWSPAFATRSWVGRAVRRSVELRIGWPRSGAPAC